VIADVEAEEFALPAELADFALGDLSLFVMLR